MAKNICERIKEARKQAGLTQIEFAKRLGIGFTTLSRYEKGHRIPDVDLVAQMVIVTKVNPAWLLTGIDAVEVEVYNEDEREYCRKLLRVLRTKQERVVTLIKQSLDVIVDSPDVAGRAEGESPPSHPMGRKAANTK